MATTWNKKERENKKRSEQKKKEERRQERKENAVKGKSLDEMLAYVDENGNLSPVPPDPRRRVVINAESIETGVPKRLPAGPDDHIRTGVITFFNGQKGFGFIEDSVSRESIFVHQSASAQMLQERMKVTFEIEKGPRGFTATNIAILN